MSLHTFEGRREAGLTLWIVGWLTSLPCLAASADDPAWRAMAFLSLSLIAVGLHLVRSGGRPARDRAP